LEHLKGIEYFRNIGVAGMIVLQWGLERNLRILIGTPEGQRVLQKY
jgi:hypothetical protein